MIIGVVGATILFFQVQILGVKVVVNQICTYEVGLCKIPNGDKTNPKFSFVHFCNWVLVSAEISYYNGQNRLNQLKLEPVNIKLFWFNKPGMDEDLN